MNWFKKIFMENEEKETIEVATAYDGKNRLVTSRIEDTTIVVEKPSTGALKEFTEEQIEEAKEYFYFLIGCNHN